MSVPTLTSNSPSSGFIAWTAFHVQYGGIAYAVNAGNTSDTYVYWLYNSGSPSATLSVSNTQPTLTADDLLLFINKSGIPTNVQSAQLIDGDLIVNGTITAANIEAGTITGSLIQAGTITGSLIGANTIVANSIVNGSLTSAQINASNIIANIIDGATISGNTINGATFNGTNWIENSHGQFLYSGTPASGNLVFSIAPAAGTDGFGNAYIAGIWAHNSTSGGAALISVSGNAGLIIPPAGTAHASTPPQVAGLAGNTGLVNEYVGLQLLSGIQTTNTGNAGIDLYSETNDATAGARGSLFITGTQVLGWNATGITAFQPIDANNPGTPTSPETWHDLRPLSNSFSFAGTGFWPPQYRMDANGNVTVLGGLTLPTTYNSTTIQTIPAGWRPAVNVYIQPMIISNAGPALSNSATPQLEITTAGVMQLHNLPTGLAGTNVVFSASYPVGNSPITS